MLRYNLIVRTVAANRGGSAALLKTKKHFCSGSFQVVESSLSTVVLDCINQCLTFRKGQLKGPCLLFSGIGHVCQCSKNGWGSGSLSDSAVYQHHSTFEKESSHLIYPPKGPCLGARADFGGGVCRANHCDRL